MIKGRVPVIVRALYGLKTSVKTWHTHIYNTLQTKMKFQSSLADNDVWLKQEMRSDGSSYYTYILVYTDDILIVSDNPTKYMAQIKAYYYVKKSSIGPPNIYLGSHVKLVRDRSGNRLYATSSDDYIKEAIKAVEQRMEELSLNFTKSAKAAQNPFSNFKYRPELDVTEF